MRRELAFEGYVDEFNEKTLKGWCYKKDDPDRHIELDIYVNDKVVKKITASRFREDLLKAGKGNGQHSFEFNMQNYLENDIDSFIIGVKISKTDIDLTSSPILVTNKKQIRKKCYLPWDNLHINESGYVHTCICPSWLGSTKYSIGNINKDSFENLWNGSKMRQYRKAFLEDNYKKFCRMDICPYLNGTAHQELPGINALSAINNHDLEVDFGPTKLVYDIDAGCNLKCIMCREDIRPVNKKVVRNAVSNIKKISLAGNLKNITASGSGEIFLFNEFIELLSTDFFSSRNISLSLITNLTILSPEIWRRIRHNDIALSVSIDGATKESYEKIRRGASWESVYKKLLYIADLLSKNEIKHVNLAYVITLNNAHEVAKIIELTNKLGFDLIFLSQRGRLPTIEDNIFETCNIGKLDMVYSLLEKVDGFNLPHVSLSSCGILNNRQYRQLHYRMEMAQYQINEYNDREMAKRIAQECLNDLKNGAIDAKHSQLSDYNELIGFSLSESY